MSTATSNSASQEPTARGYRVLVVEDDQTLARATRRTILERDDCEVELAHDVASARASIDRGGFDVVFSDFELPDGTGADVLRRALRAIPDAPRILVTSHTEWSAATRTVNEGEVYRILQKPLPAEALHATLADALDLKRRRDEEREQASAIAREQRALAEQNSRLSVRASYLDRLVDARMKDLLAILLEGLELRAAGTRRRARCVAAVARRIGELAEMSGSELDDLELAGLLHGVGALAGCGDGDESEPFGAPRTLGRLGHDLLRPAAFLRGVAWLIRDFERPFASDEDDDDAREETPIGARALAVAVRYVELVGDGARVGQGSHDAACAILEREAGTRLDPALVAQVAEHPVDAWNAILRAARHEAAP